MKTVVFPPPDIVEQTAQKVSATLTESVSVYEHVFLLLSAGSWVSVYQSMAPLLASRDMGNLTVGLVDERYVPKGHADSNDRQISDSHLIKNLVSQGATYIPVLQDIDPGPTMTTLIANTAYGEIFSHHPHVIMTLGLGPDGHTAGILPSSSASLFDARFHDHADLVYYETTPSETANPYTKRITISPSSIQKADEIIIYAAGAAKKPIIDRIETSDDPPYLFPAGILRPLSDRVTVYTDVE